MIAIGLMSGTSADGIDAALVRTDGDCSYEFIDALTVGYDRATRSLLLECAQDQSDLEKIARAENQLTGLHGAAIDHLLDRVPRYRGRVDVVGFHGHTILHRPDQGRTRQLGDGIALSRQLGCPVVYDFRQADIRASGQGAPLAPLFHAMLFTAHRRPTAIVNIGGVGNMTWIAEDGTIFAGDTGPGCGLLDCWIQSQTDQPWDQDGRFSKLGNIHSEIVEQSLSAPYFHAPFPKSADRFDFDAINVSGLSTEDGAATLACITATSIIRAAEKMGVCRELWVTGGGARNPTIRQLLAQYFPAVRTVEKAGYRGDSLEAECFAWLAVRRLYDLPATLPTTTGCKQPTVCGIIAREGVDS